MTSQQSLSSLSYVQGEEMIPTGVNVHSTMSFFRADIGSDHNLMAMAFRVCLKMTKKPNHSGLRFDLETFTNPDIAGRFNATMVGKFASLINLKDVDIDTDSMITTYNITVTDIAKEILGK